MPKYWVMTYEQHPEKIAAREKNKDAKSKRILINVHSI